MLKRTGKRQQGIADQKLNITFTISLHVIIALMSNLLIICWQLTPPYQNPIYYQLELITAKMWSR